MTDDERNDLPLPDYDHHTTGSLRSRIQGLDAEWLQALITYERAHAARASMLTVLEGRLDALRRGAEPSLRAAPSGPGPETATGGSGGSKADPATAGPPVNPPSHGDPTNPAQPRGWPPAGTATETISPPNGRSPNATSAPGSSRWAGSGFPVGCMARTGHCAARSDEEHSRQEQGVGGFDATRHHHRRADAGISAWNWSAGTGRRWRRTRAVGELHRCLKQWRRPGGFCVRWGDLIAARRIWRRDQRRTRRPARSHWTRRQF